MSIRYSAPRRAYTILLPLSIADSKASLALRILSALVYHRLVSYPEYWIIADFCQFGSSISYEFHMIVSSLPLLRFRKRLSRIMVSVGG